MGLRRPLMTGYLGLDLGPLLALGQPAPMAPPQEPVGDELEPLEAPDLPALERMERGSGMAVGAQAKASREMEDRRKLGEKTATIMTPEQWEELTGRVRQMPEYQAQEEGIRRLEALQERFSGAPPQLDLTPLLALADAQTGSRFAQSYHRPAGPQERLAGLAELEGAAQKQRGQMADLILSSLRPQITGETLAEQLMNLTTGQAVQETQEAQDPTMRPAPGGLTPYQQYQMGRNAQKDLEAAIRDHRNTTKKAAELAGTYQELAARIRPYVGGDIPGIGPYDSAKAALGLGSKDDIGIWQSISKMADDVLRERSGAAINEGEASRLRGIIGKGRLMSEPEALEAMEIMGRAIHRGLTHSETPLSARPQALQMFEESGGITSRTFKPFETGTKRKGGDDTVPVISPDGRRGRIPKAKLGEALKRGYKKAE